MLRLCLTTHGETSSDNVSEFEDFIGGVSLGVSHAFKSLIGFVRLPLFIFQICLFLTHLLDSTESRIYLQVEELLIEGKELADNNQFSQSLRIFNQALGLLKQTPARIH